MATRSWSEIGELWMLGAAIGFATSNVFDRAAVVQVDPFVGAFYKSIPPLAFACLLLSTRGTWKQMAPSSPRYIGAAAIRLLAFSGLLSIGGLIVYFYALRLSGLAITVPFLQTQIIWATIMAWVFMQERFNRKALAGLATVVAGLMLLSYGQTLGRAVSAQWPLGVPLGLVAALCFGAAGTIARAGQLGGADQSTGLFLRFSTSIVVVLALLAASGRWGLLLQVSGVDLAKLVASGVLNGVVAIYCFFTALRLMSVGRAFALNGLNPIIAVFFGYALLGEYVNAVMLTGIVLASAGIVLVQVFKPVEKKA